MTSDNEIFSKLEIRSVERGICPIPLKSDVTIVFVPRLQFPVRRENFGDSRTFNAVIGLLLILACILKTSSRKIRVGGALEENGGKVMRCLPQRTRFYFWVFTCVNLVKISQDMPA